MTNTVEKVEFMKMSLQDEFVRSEKDYNKYFRYSPIQAVKSKIRDKGKVKISLNWKRISLQVNKKYLSKELLKETRSRIYAPSWLLDFVFDYDCTGYETLHLTIRTKIRDPNDNFEFRQHNVIYKSKNVATTKNIDTTEFCNGFVPKKLIIYSR